MPLSDPACVVFDLDGTLADTAQDVADVFGPLLEGMGRRRITRAEVISCFGLGAGRFAERAAALTGPKLPEAEGRHLLEAFLARYTTAPPATAALYPGAREALEGCRAAGWRVAVCTNKPQAATMLLLAHLGIDGLVDGVSGGDAAPARKPDPVHLLDAIARAGGTSARAVMVGDSETDVAVARATGIPSVLVEGGYRNAPAAPDVTIDSLAALMPVLRRMLIRAPARSSS